MHGRTKIEFWDTSEHVRNLYFLFFCLFIIFFKGNYYFDAHQLIHEYSGLKNSQKKLRTNERTFALFFVVRARDIPLCHTIQTIVHWSENIGSFSGQSQKHAQIHAKLWHTICAFMELITRFVWLLPFRFLRLCFFLFLRWTATCLWTFFCEYFYPYEMCRCNYLFLTDNSHWWWLFACVNSIIHNISNLLLLLSHRNGKTVTKENLKIITTINK